MKETKRNETNRRYSNPKNIFYKCDDVQQIANLFNKTKTEAETETETNKNKNKNGDKTKDQITSMY